MLKKRFVRWSIPQPELYVDPDSDHVEPPQEDQEEVTEKGLLHYLGAETWYDESLGVVMTTVFAFVERVPDGQMVKIPAEMLRFVDR